MFQYARRRYLVSVYSCNDSGLAHSLHSNRKQLEKFTTFQKIHKWKEIKEQTKEKHTKKNPRVY